MLSKRCFPDRFSVFPGHGSGVPRFGITLIIDVIDAEMGIAGMILFNGLSSSHSFQPFLCFDDHLFQAAFVSNSLFLCSSCFGLVSIHNLVRVLLGPGLI